MAPSKIRIGIVGWGRIAHDLARLLEPFEVDLMVYSRRGTLAEQLIGQVPEVLKTGRRTGRARPATAHRWTALTAVR